MSKDKKPKENKDITALKFQNKHLKLIGDILDVPKHGAIARSRNRVIKLIDARFKEFEDARLEMLNKFGTKDKDGNLKKEEVLQPNGKTASQFIIKKPDEFKKAIEVLLDEKIVIDILPSNRLDFANVVDMVLNCRHEFGVLDTDIYEEICQQFELLK